MTTTLPILHFNDVYRVVPQKYKPGSSETIDTTQFAWLVDSIRDQWPALEGGSDSSNEGTKAKKDGLLLFSGDVFSPSVESSVTRGSHMVPVLNELGIDVSVTGNHDFDFGYPHLTKLVADTQFPWLLSNIIDNTTGKIPKGLHEFHVLERRGLKIGFIGLVEKEWITTVSSWPQEFEYRDMAQTALDISKKLRDPEGEYKVDLIIALTHCRLPNDIQLAKALSVFTPIHQKSNPITSLHGVDLLLGGHDHLYFIPKGVDAWEGFDYTQPQLGGEEDKGDVLIIKSGNDFRDLSEIELEVKNVPDAEVRKWVINKVTGKRRITEPSMPKSEKMSELLKKLLASVGSSLKAPVCQSTVQLDLRGYHIRTTESAAGNWFADIIRPAYDDTLMMHGGPGADGVFICAGTLRGDSTYGPGTITLGDIMEILPFEDPAIVLEMDGHAIWDALEGGLSTYPAQEGRFPVISGFKVEWDSRREPGNRVLDVNLIKEADTYGESGTVHLEPIKKEKGGRTYRIVTREYMAGGHDGYDALKTCKQLVDEEGGMLMSAIVRKYLIGSHFLNRVTRLQKESSSASPALHPRIQRALSSEEVARGRWKSAVHKIIDSALHHASHSAGETRRTGAHYSHRQQASCIEHMSDVDVFDGARTRKGEEVACNVEPSQDLLVISPIIDSRFRDVARAGHE